MFHTRSARRSALKRSVVQGTALSIDVRECSDAGSAQRLLRPPLQLCALDCHTTCGCATRTAAASRSVLDLSCCTRSCAAAQRRRPTCARPAAARATCSLCWRCCPWPGRQLPDGWPCPYMPSSCTSAAVPRLTTRGVAQPHRSPCAGQLKPERPSSAISTPLSARGRMCSQAVFRRDG